VVGIISPGIHPEKLWFLALQGNEMLEESWILLIPGHPSGHWTHPRPISSLSQNNKFTHILRFFIIITSIVSSEFCTFCLLDSLITEDWKTGLQSFLVQESYFALIILKFHSKNNMHYTLEIPSYLMYHNVVPAEWDFQ
jgi:hypothetical protein